MANAKHLRILRQGVDVWNDWRENSPRLSSPDLRMAHLVKAKLSGADLKGANLSGAILMQADLKRANLHGALLNLADLTQANLNRAILIEADLGQATLNGAELMRAKLMRANLDGATLIMTDLRAAKLNGAKLRVANLMGANLQRADLSEADLNGVQLTRADLRNATLTGSKVYGASVWDIQANDRTQQQNLIITSPSELVITVDNIKVAQFIYLLLNNQEIREVIDTVGRKAVLILGRFSEERKPVLDAIREELRKPPHNYLPIVFDFQPSANQSTIETVTALAGMARFVVADLTDARSVLQELQAIIPALPSVAVHLLIKRSAPEYGMLDHIRLFRSVVENTYAYEDEREVIVSIRENIVAPAEAKVEELRRLIRPATR